MHVRILSVLLAAAALLGTTMSASEASTRPGAVAHAKGVAERNVVRLATRGWGRHGLAPLLDRRTGLLKNNVRIICKGRGHRYAVNRYRRFVCVLRSWPVAGGQDLYVTYRALQDGFRVHWLHVRAVT